MQSNKLGNWLQILGNVAILVGLIFVAVQLYQDRELKAIEMSVAQLDNALQLRMALLGEEPYQVLVKSLTEGAELTREEALILSQVYAAELILYEQTLYMQQVGLWPQYDLGIPLSMATESGQRHIYANLDALPLSDSTRLIWTNLLESGKYDGMLADVVDAIRNDEAATVLKDRIREFKESAGN